MKKIKVFVLFDWVYVVHPEFQSEKRELRAVLKDNDLLDESLRNESLKIPKILK